MEAEAMSRAEIDTSVPFGSVKEAVVLFGERVLATQVYACTKLKQMQSIEGTEYDHHDEEEATSELEETKQRLRKARKESMKMAKSLFALQQELHETKTELQQLKSVHESDHRMILDLDTVEEIRIVEDREADEIMETKKYVRFADPPFQVTSTHDNHQAVLQRQASIKKKKKKQFIPFLKRVFLKKS